VITRTKIPTAFGDRYVVRRFGVTLEYYETIPTKSAPHGEFWVLNPQRGFVPVSSTSRGLVRAKNEVR
jgi:hypothetical protein